MPQPGANNDDASTHSGEAGGCNKPKSPYSSPQLLIYGDLRILTMGGGGVRSDGMMTSTRT
jgi:hypothetical protein